MGSSEGGAGADLEEVGGARGGRRGGEVGLGGGRQRLTGEGGGEGAEESGRVASLGQSEDEWRSRGHHTTRGGPSGRRRDAGNGRTA